MLENTKEIIGYFDERFFFLVEDVDLAWRVQRKGWKAIYYPQIICFYCDNSSGFDKECRQYLCFCNQYYSIAKNQGLKDYFKKFLPFLLYDIPRIFYLIFTNYYIYN